MDKNIINNQEGKQMKNINKGKSTLFGALSAILVTLLMNYIEIKNPYIKFPVIFFLALGIFYTLDYLTGGYIGRDSSNPFRKK